MKPICCILAVILFLHIPQALGQVSETDITRKQLELGVFALKQGDAKGPNVTVSPYSIHAALMLLRLGGRGAVAAEIDDKLLPTPFAHDLQGVYRALNAKVTLSNEQVTSTLANAVWLQSEYPFDKAYLESSLRLFASEPRSVDFKAPELAREKINTWVSSKTNSLIPTLLAPGALSSNSTCVLVNALYFKSAWLNPFGKHNTREGEFWISPSQSVKVPMMWSTDSMGYFEGGGWQGVHLPYQSFEFLFVLLVPKERRQLSEVAQDISPDLIARSLQESAFAKVQLALPRFKARFSTDLVEQLKRYGIVNLQNGDYSGISPRNVGVVGSVIHEAVVSVDEGGTEAAAATAVTMAKGIKRTDEREPIQVHADRPFAFAIVHRSSKAPLFVGMVGDPR